ncbi:MAG: nucleotidyltransferase family protein [Magnetospirillum sp.]|nr:nucleotidyltransferase family protein [Magnetospirillum sp.]
MRSSPVVLVLAAGRGERFRAAGGAGHKLSALLGGMTVLERTLAAVRASGLPSHVVDAPTEGMGWSIAAGVSATIGAGGWLILPGDMPLVSPATIRRVASALAKVPVVAPVHGGRRGHPVGFGPPCRGHLLALSGDLGARRVIQAFGRLDLPVEDPGCVLDIDTPFRPGPCKEDP